MQKTFAPQPSHRALSTFCPASPPGPRHSAGEGSRHDAVSRRHEMKKLLLHQKVLSSRLSRSSSGVALGVR
eukprot:992608-Amphidinium_carterae.1